MPSWPGDVSCRMTGGGPAWSMIVVDPAVVGFDPGLAPGVVRAELGRTVDEICAELPHALKTKRLRPPAARRAPRLVSTGTVLQPRA